jgi:hypothetical protein
MPSLSLRMIEFSVQYNLNLDGGYQTCNSVNLGVNFYDLKFGGTFKNE